jgi:hypothetical protein
MSNANRYSDDLLQNFINRVMKEGVWCDLKASDTLAHKMVCRRSQSTIAISLCGQIIKPFESLHENTVTRKCLVCSLYDQSPKEVQDRHNVTLSTLAESIEQTQTQTEKE